MKKLTIVVEEDVLRRFHLLALKEQSSMSEILRGFITAYVKRKENQA